MKIRRSRFFILLPLVILCVTGRVENSGIEYHGTSSVRVQKPYTPTHQSESPLPSSESPIAPVTSPKQPKHNASPSLEHFDVQSPIDVTTESAIVAFMPQNESVYTTSQVSKVTEDQLSITSSPPPVILSSKSSAGTTVPPITATQKPVETTSQIPSNFKKEPADAASQTPVIVSSELSTPASLQPSTEVDIQIDILDISSELCSSADTSTTYDAPQSSTVASPQQTVTITEPTEIAPVVKAAFKSSAPLIAPEAEAPALASVYPLKSLPPLLPEPKPIRRPEFIRYTQPTLVYPSYTSPATIQYEIQPTLRISTHHVPKRVPPKQSVSLKLDFDCQQANGYYAIQNECDAYIECKQFKALKFTCPDGLHFNSAAKWKEYPCTYPSVARCMAGIENQNPRPTNLCPRQYGFFSMNDGDCSKYIMCQNGIATIMNCPAGLAFNPVTDSCDWQVNVPQCNPNVFRGFTCPEAPLDRYGYASNIISKYRYQNHCRYYIACQRGHPRLLSCDSGLAFDENSQSCINKNYVARCSTANVHKT